MEDNVFSCLSPSPDPSLFPVPIFSIRISFIILGELEEGRKTPDIDDPIGGDRTVYERTRDEIDRLTALLIEYLIDKFGLKR